MLVRLFNGEVILNFKIKAEKGMAFNDGLTGLLTLGLIADIEKVYQYLAEQVVENLFLPKPTI